MHFWTWQGRCWWKSWTGFLLVVTSSWMTRDTSHGVQSCSVAHYIMSIVPVHFKDNAIMLYIMQEMYAGTKAKINVFDVYSVICDTNTNYQKCRLHWSIWLNLSFSTTISNAGLLSIMWTREKFKMQWPTENYMIIYFPPCFEKEGGWWNIMWRDEQIIQVWANTNSMGCGERIQNKIGIRKNDFG